MRTALAVLACVVPFLPAQNPYLHRDVNLTGLGSVNPGSGFAPLGTTPGNPPVHWFSANRPDTGTELWRMQGNNQALPVGDNAPGIESSNPVLIDPGPPAVFVMDHPDTGRELWRVNAQGQLEALPEAVPGPLGALYSETVSMGGATYVMRTTETGSAELLRVVNGQATVVTALAGVGGQTAFASLAADASGLLHIFLHQEPLPDEHYVSDCTAIGTRLVPGDWRDVALARDELFGGDALDGRGSELHKFGATSTTLVLDINPAGSSSPSGFVRIGPNAYFAATQGQSDRELWQSDGTASGTRRVADLRPGSAGSDPRALTAFQGNLYFVADDGTNGRELHFLDVATQVVRAVKDIRAGNLDSAIEELFVLGAAFYFAADDGIAGRELWRSDGTSNGTALVRDAFPGAQGSRPGSFFALDSALGYGADDGVHGFELWRSDGTAAGTALQQDLSPAVTRNETSNPYGFHDAGWDTIFGATETGSGTELYRVTFNGDLPAAGRIKNINPGGRNSDPRDFVTLPDGRVLFTAVHITFGREVWVTDGTDAGTVMVKDIRPGNIGSEPFGLLWVPGLRAVLFDADDGTTGREPWVSDGTAAGTARLADINPGPAPSEAGKFALRRDGTVFFGADDGQAGYEPWVLDPGSRTPRLLADLLNVGFGSFPRSITFVDDGNGGELTFFAADALLGRHALYVTDGTAAGTRQIRAFRTIGSIVGFVDGRAYFGADDGVAGVELWKSDGTAAGTMLVADIAAGAFDSSPGLFTPMVESFQAATSKLFFVAGTTLGIELCVIGPHPVHNLRILDIHPWDGSSNPRELAVERGPFPRLVFSADAGDGSGHEFWTTLGTQQTTQRVADINKVQGIGSDPSGLTPTADGWLMSADDGVHGREVWRIGSLRGVALTRGTGCGSAPPTLQATPPRIGATLRLSGETGSGVAGALLLNGPRRGAGATPLFGCGYTFDPLTSVIIPIPGQDRAWSLALPLPGDPLLVDVQVETRTLFVSVAPFDLQASASVLLALGN